MNREEVRKVLQSTYQYWDGYYIPSGEWTEDHLIDEILKELNAVPNSN